MQPIQPPIYQSALKPLQPSFPEMKSAAKRALKNRWAEAIVVSLVFLSASLLDSVMQAVLMTILKVDTVWSILNPTGVATVSVLASNAITLFSAVFSLAVMFPLIYGVLRWFWQVTGGGDPAVGEIFYYFSSSRLFFKSLGLSFGLFWRLIVGALVCFFPYNILGVLTEPAFYAEVGIAMPVVMQSFTPLVDTFEFLGFFALLLYIAVYAMFYTVLFSEPQLSSHRTIKESKSVSKSNRVRFIGFIFSFFGWFLLSPLVLPLLFTIPYFLSSLTVFGREAYRFSHRVTV